MRKLLDPALLIAPDDPAFQVQRASVEFDARRDSKPMHDAIDAVLATDPTTAATVADLWYQLAIYEGDAGNASRTLASMKASGAHEEGVPYPRMWCEGVMLGCGTSGRGQGSLYGCTSRSVAGG